MIRYLEAEANEKIVPGETLIILDEIQSCERAVTSLKYFEEEAPKYNIAAAGSLLGVTINREHFSFPVGKVKTLQLFPMDFEEFLWAKNEHLLIDEIVNGYKNIEPLPEGLHNKAIELYQDYLIVGGMPACINKYIETDSYIDVSIV
ncbi:MAG: AAA family ATPase, partial [Lutispora sp.]